MIWLLLVVLLIPSVANSATHWVGASATGDGLGDDVSNLCGGITDLDCTPTAGDTVYLCGAFTSQIVPQAVNGTATAYITYDGSCPGGTAFSMAYDGSAASAISIASRSYHWWKNLTITGTTTTGFPGGSILISGGSRIKLDTITISGNTNNPAIHGRTTDNGEYRNLTLSNGKKGVHLTSGCSNIIVDTFTVTGMTQEGVIAEGTTVQSNMVGITVTNGTLSGNGDGIYIKIADRIAVSNNVSHDNDNVSSTGEGYGIAFQQVTNGKAIGNTLYDNRTSGLEFWGNASLSSNGCVAAGNTIYNHTHYTADHSGSNGIKVNTGYAQGCLVYGNAVFNNTRQLRIGQDPAGTSVIANNTLYGGVTGIEMADSNIAGTDAVTGWTIINNIFDAHTANWIETMVAAGNTNTFSKNNFAGSVQSSYNGVTYTKADITTVDSTATTVDPVWLSTDKSDANGLRFGYNATLRGTGTQSATCMDVRGRSSCWVPPDIGAYQAGSGDPAATRAVRN